MKLWKHSFYLLYETKFWREGKLFHRQMEGPSDECNTYYGSDVNINKQT